VKRIAIRRGPFARRVWFPLSASVRSGEGDEGK
jgi:hypothetical protein